MVTPIMEVPYPDRYHLARRYGDEGLELAQLSDSDRLLLYALSSQATHGPCTEPKPSMWDSAARAKWNAWRELADQNRSSMECMVLYVNAIEELAPDWWRWPPLGLVPEATPAAKPATELAEPPAKPVEPVTEAAPPEKHVALPPLASIPDGGDAEEEEDDEEAAADAALVAELDGRVATRSSAPPPNKARVAADVALIARLTRRLHELLSDPPRARNMRAMCATLHALACLGALGAPPVVREEAPVDLAMRAAAPAEVGELELPTRVQHIALMLVVNVSLNATGAARIGRKHSEVLQSLAETAEDPRSRSLAHCALDNVAQHSGILHHLTRRAAPGKLQLAAPEVMLATFARLERACHSAPPPCMPGSRQLPEAFCNTPVEAAEAQAAAHAQWAAATPPTGTNGHAPPSAAAPAPSADAPNAASTRALGVVLVCARELHSLLHVKLSSGATAPWGLGELGVVLSTLAHVLQQAPASRADLVAAVLFEAHAVHALFTLLGSARRAADDAGCEGSLWCLASLAHLCGGRALHLSQPEHEALLYASLSTSTPRATPSVLLALSALRAAAADPLTVRRVARQLKRVQELFRSEVTDIALLACAVVANVEQYSHARLWYARPQSEAAQLFDAPPPPPPPPLILYSQEPPTPELFVDMVPATNAPNGGAHGSSEAGGAKGGADASVLNVPQLACQLHPWMSKRLRRLAVVRLAHTLLEAWQRGSHDAVLLYLLEASLVPRRLGFILSRDFEDDDPTGYAHATHKHSTTLRTPPPDSP